MTICITLIGVYSYALPEDLKSALTAYTPIYWLESAAIWAFGVSWLVKSGNVKLLED